MADVLDTGPAAPPEPTPEAAAGAAPSPPRTMGAIEAAVAVESGVRRKQAVVVVHGIGEQRPLETLRAFVETVYRRDLGLTVKGDDTRINDPDLGELNRIWVVPDEATGTVELRRITTPPNQDGVRTDFFEFYWADIMDSTPLELVTGWIRGLLVRSPFNVPLRAPVYIAWVMLWILTILMAAFAFAIVEPEEGPFLAFVTNIVNTLAPWREWILKGAAALGLAMLAYQFGKTIVDRAIALRRMKTGVPMQRLGQTLPKFGPSLMTALAGAAAYFLLAVDATANAKIWAGGLTALAGVVIAGLVVPYVGDIARFARPTPATIAKREEVRKRGLTLLKALHDERADDDRPLYSRIVLVGHSLGAVVAYDFLQHFWGGAGPNHSQKKLDQAVLVELEALDAFVKGTWPGELSSEKPQKVDIDAFQNAQSRVFKALVDTNHGWRISDFVTIGSPLVHSEFLISDNRRTLRREFIERFRSASPPRPDYPSQSMLYEYAQATYVHFAAPFSVVRWNNLYDYCWFPFGGDIVSGPVSDVFGPGIRERHVRIRRARVLRPLNRAFTHTLYWQWPHGVESEKVPDYIRELREAMRL